jgi:hypothetical protein
LTQSYTRQKEGNLDLLAVSKGGREGDGVRGERERGKVLKHGNARAVRRPR